MHRHLRRAPGAIRAAAGSLGRAWQRLPLSRRVSLLGVLALVAVCVTVLPVPDVMQVRAWVASAGALGPLAYLVLMVSFTQLPFPRTVWTIAAGFLFGPLLGSALAVTGLAVSATCSLLLVRGLGAWWLRPAGGPSSAASPRVAALRDVIRERGWVAVLGLRMVPLVPFSPLNYACALSGIPLLPFVAATVAGSSPTTVVTVVASDAIATGGHPWVLLLSAAVAAAGVALSGRELTRWRSRVGTATPAER